MCNAPIPAHHDQLETTTEMIDAVEGELMALLGPSVLDTAASGPREVAASCCETVLTYLSSYNRG